MEWAVIVLASSLLAGFGIATYIYKDDERGRSSSDYIYVVILWWIMLPIAAYKSFMDHPLHDEEHYEDTEEDDREDPGS